MKLKKDQAYSNLLRIASQARSMREAKIELDNTAASLPLNYFIKKIYGLENDELATFNAWKEKGYIVKKGEKAFIFFSSPKSIKAKSKDIKTGEDVETAFNLFCKCYLFSKSQVEELKK